MAESIIIFIICYLICSISPAIEICKRVLHKDIREEGSKNAGTTNAIRVMGKGLGAAVFILDILKVIIAYLFSMFVTKIFKTSMTEVLSRNILSCFSFRSYISYILWL